MAEEQEWRMDMENRITTMAGLIEEFHHDYFGNHQPGFKKETNDTLRIITDALAEQRGAWKTVKTFGTLILSLVVTIGVFVGWLTYRDAQLKTRTLYLTNQPGVYSTEKPSQGSVGP